MAQVGTPEPLAALAKVAGPTEGKKSKVPILFDLRFGTRIPGRSPNFG